MNDGGAWWMVHMVHKHDDARCLLVGHKWWGCMWCVHDCRSPEYSCHGSCLWEHYSVRLWRTSNWPAWLWVNQIKLWTDQYWPVHAWATMQIDSELTSGSPDSQTMAMKGFIWISEICQKLKIVIYYIDILNQMLWLKTQFNTFK